MREAASMAPEPQGQEFKTGAGDTQVRWMCFGSGGRPLVLLHGGHGTWKHWIRNVQALSAQRKVWLPDMPGFGASAGSPPQGDTAQRLAWVEDVLVQSLQRMPFALGAFDLAGFSFGALVAAGIAARTPVRRLALLGPAGHGTPRQHEFVFQDWQHVTNVGEALEALRHNLSALMLGGGEPDDFALRVHEEGYRTCRVSTRALSRMTLLPRRMSQLRMPVLALWGEHDATGVPHVVADSMGMAGPDRSWRVVKDAAHWVQFQQAAEVNRILDQWFIA